MVVFDSLGKVQKILVIEKLQTGSYEVNFDGHKLSCGIYFYKLVAGDFIDVNKMILVK